MTSDQFAPHRDSGMIRKNVQRFSEQITPQIKELKRGDDSTKSHRAFAIRRRYQRTTAQSTESGRITNPR
jgi:hypothetical protein